MVSNSVLLGKVVSRVKDEVAVSVIQFAPDWLKTEHNARRMAEMAGEEARNGAELIVFPELANVGYLSSFHGFDLDFARQYYEAAEPVPGPTTERLGEVARKTKSHIAVGLAQRHPTISGCLYNTAVLIGPEGSMIGQQHKVHIPAGEKHYFIPGNRLAPFDTALGRIGLAVCYDSRFPETTRTLALQGAEIVCGMWARFWKGGFLAGEGNYHMAFIRAQENALYYIHCNRTGVEGETRYLGHSAIGAPNGELVAKSTGDEEECIRAVLKHSTLVDSRLFLSIYRDRRPELYGPLVTPLA